jgi:DNA-binding Xre family transcriptional regulator
MMLEHPHLPDGWLDQRGLSARDLARMAGVNEQTVGAARRGRSIAPRTLQKICRALATSDVLLPSLPTPAAPRKVSSPHKGDPA